MAFRRRGSRRRSRGRRAHAGKRGLNVVGIRL